MMRHSFLTCSLALLTTTVVFAEETLQSLEQAALRAAAARVAFGRPELRLAARSPRLGAVSCALFRNRDCVTNSTRT